MPAANSGYRWEDAVGPRERRPKRLDLAWHSLCAPFDEWNLWYFDRFNESGKITDVNTWPYAPRLSRKEAVEGISRRPGFAKTGWVDRRQQRRLAPVGVVEGDLTASPWHLPSVDDFDWQTFASVGPG